MAEGILKYDLDNPDDVIAHKRAVKSFDVSMALWEIIYNTKKGLEWSLEGKDVDKYEVLELVYEKIYQILDEHNVIIDELIN